MVTWMTTEVAYYNAGDFVTVSVVSRDLYWHSITAELFFFTHCKTSIQIEIGYGLCLTQKRFRGKKSPLKTRKKEKGTE